MQTLYCVARLREARARNSRLAGHNDDRGEILDRAVKREALDGKCPETFRPADDDRCSADFPTRAKTTRTEVPGASSALD